MATEIKEFFIIIIDLYLWYIFDAMFYCIFIKLLHDLNFKMSGHLSSKNCKYFLIYFPIE